MRVPPVAVGLVVTAGIWALARWVPEATYRMPGHAVLAGAVLAAGCWTAIKGVMDFHRHKTTVNPLQPEKATTLVVDGIYRYSRNPMYLGMALVLGGWVVWQSNLLGWLGLPAFVLWMNRMQIAHEETALRAKFGPAFDAYAARVRRWV